MLSSLIGAPASRGEHLLPLFRRGFEIVTIPENRFFATQRVKEDVLGFGFWVLGFEF